MADTGILIVSHSKNLAQGLFDLISQVAADVANLLADAGVEVVYKKLGNYMTSIDMAGISLTFIQLDQPDWLKALNSPVTTAAW